MVVGWGLGRYGGKWGRVKDELEHPDLQSRALCSKKGAMPYVRNGTGEWRAGVVCVCVWGGGGIGERWRFVVRYRRNIAPPPPRGRGYVEAEEKAVAAETHLHS